MSEYEYNNLLFEISQRLDNINVGKQLLVICRGKLAARRGEENIPTFSLFEELEEKGFLSSDRLSVLKAMLKGVKEWAFLEEVEKFEYKKTEYNNLLEQIIRELDEINDLERLVSICCGKITEERQASIHDVRSLLKELESNGLLGIDCLRIMKEILTQTEKSDLLKEVEEFEQRQRRENKFERRKAQAAAIASSAIDKMAAVLNIKTVFKVVVGGFTMASSLELLIRDSTYDQLVAAVNTCVLPAGAHLIQISDGCVCLKVQVESLATLETLWRLYEDGILKAKIQALLVTDEMRELAGGEQVEAIVTIDEQEYDKASDKLSNETQDDPKGKEERHHKYLEQEKYEYIQNYLEQAGDQTKDLDAHSVMGEGDSGKPGSSSVPSEVGTEETNDSPSKLCLNDLSEDVTAELTSKLRSDPVTLERFYQSFGLDPKKLSARGLRNIGEFFPDTPVKLLKEVFEALRLYDLVELLEKVTKPRTLRPALSLKEIEKLPNVSDRPTKFYSKVQVLIIEYSDSAARDDDAERIGSFFKGLNPLSQVTTLRAKPPGELLEDLAKLRESQRKKEDEVLIAESREAMLKDLLEKKIPSSWYGGERRMIWWSRERFIPDTNEQLLSLFYKEEPEMKKELKELAEKREQWTKKRIPVIEEIKQKEKELKEENEKFEVAVSDVIDKWIEHAQANDEGKESVLSVILIVNSFKRSLTDGSKFMTLIRGCLREKLALIPETKLLITNSFSSVMEKEEIPRETLQLYLPRRIVLASLLELLNKRWKTMDLISVMLELKRTFVTRGETILHEEERLELPFLFLDDCTQAKMDENLSCLPRLQKTELVDRDK